MLHPNRDGEIRLTLAFLTFHYYKIQDLSQNGYGFSFSFSFSSKLSFLMSLVGQNAVSVPLKGTALTSEVALPQ